MTDQKAGGGMVREVWVMEKEGLPVAPFTDRKIAEAIALDYPVVRYVPDSRPQERIAEGGWVPASEPPESDGYYLCYRMGYLPQALPFTRGQWGKTILWAHCEPTHWRPLPPGPEAD